MLAKISCIFLALLGTAFAADEQPSAAAQPTDPWLQAQAAVAQNIRTEAGKKFADSVAAAAVGPLSAALQGCRDSLEPGLGKNGAAADSVGSEVYVMLSRRGMAKALLVRPQRKMEACMIARVRAGRPFPNPLGPNYWIKVNVASASATPRSPLTPPGTPSD